MKLIPLALFFILFCPNSKGQTNSFSIEDEDKNKFASIIQTSGNSISNENQESELSAITEFPYETPEHKSDHTIKLNKLLNEGISIEEFKADYGDLVIDSLFYKVQIGAYKSIENFDYANTASLGAIIRKVYDDGITRFTIGNYSHFNEAFAHLKLIKDKSIKDAFIIVYYKNKYFYLKDILKKGIAGN